MQQTFFIIIFMFYALNASGQQDPSDTIQAHRELIPWAAGYKLKWSDFKGKKDTADIAFKEMKAACAAEILAIGYIDSGVINFRVTNNFDPNHSWIIDSTGRGSDHLLEHEQLHFDIAEVYTRLLRQKIEELIKAGNRNMEDYNGIISRLHKERKDRDLMYDNQTAHGMAFSKQQEWRVIIYKELEILSDYMESNKIE